MLKATACGRLTKNAKIIDYSNGNGTMVVCTLACNNSRNPDAAPTYVDCLFMNRGESLAQYLLQGNQLTCSGSLELKKNGEYSNLTMVVDDFDFGAKKQ